MRAVKAVTLLVLCLLAFASCGIEEFVYLVPVDLREHSPSEDATYNYFAFRTTDAKNQDEAGDYFKGFEIYYRIYNNESVRSSDAGAINNYNDDDPTIAYNFLKNTKKYVRLLTSGRGTTTPLIPAAAANRTVRIRLIRYTDILPSFILEDMDGNVLDDYGRPLRSVSEKLGSDPTLFEFDEIGEGDDDVTWSTWTDENDKQLYVQAYVMAYGFDASYKQLYSELFYLGYITLTKDDKYE